MGDRIILTQKELDDLVKFRREHFICNNLIILETSGASGIAKNIYAICARCQREKDITDYESW
jgi:hypothetical protein